MSFILPLLLFFMPILFLPITGNFFSTPRQGLLILSTMVLLVAWLLPTLTKKELTLPSLSSLSLPLILFVISLIVNLVLHKEGFAESMLNRGSLFLSLSLLIYLLSALPRTQASLKRALLSFLAGTSVLSLHSILQLTFLHSLTALPVYMQTQAFTLTGSPFTTVTLLFLGFITALTWTLSTKATPFRYFLGFMALIQAIALIAYLALMTPGKPLAIVLLPMGASWSIALDALKTPVSALFGTGLSNFSSLFTQVKPLSLNTTPFWNALPSTASSEALQLLITTGLIGFIAFFFLILKAFKIARSLPSTSLNKTLRALFLGLIFLFFFTPVTIPFYTLLFIVFLFLDRSGEIKTISLPTPAIAVILVLGLSVVSLTGFYSVKAVLAEYHINLAQKAFAANDGRTVYDENLKAINLFPTLTSYHLAYSSVNLQLASAISQKTELTDTDRTNITTLLQQAVREATTATNLLPSSSNVWQNLGSIYRNIINVATDAETYAINAYARAVALDPANPALRVEYGGLFYQLATSVKDKTLADTYLSRAIQEFQTSAQLKANYANAYYNLSKALETGGNIQGAYSAMQQVIINLDTASADFSTASSELEALKARLPAPTPTPEAAANGAPSELTEPSPLPSPLPGGPIILPEETTSPAPEPTPTP